MLISFSMDLIDRLICCVMMMKIMFVVMIVIDVV